MKSKKVLISLALASVLVLAQAATAFAAGTSGGQGIQPGEREAMGHTTVSIMQTAVDPTNVSFTVPLYVTMAVKDGETNVVVPSNYKIKNTSGTGCLIGVTDMSIERLSDAKGTFKTVAYNATAPTSDSELMLSIGGVDMPATPALNQAVPVDLKTTSGRSGSKNVFWNGTKGTPNPIAVDETKDLTLIGTVSSATRAASAAVAQFRLKYTISLLNTEGAPLGIVYAGDDSTAAGLGVYTATPAN